MVDYNKETCFTKLFLQDQSVSFISTYVGLNLYVAYTKLSRKVIFFVAAKTSNDMVYTSFSP